MHVGTGNTERKGAMLFSSAWPQICK